MRPHNSQHTGADCGQLPLAQVDKADLPILIEEKDGCRHELTAAKLTLTAENKYTFEATVRETCGEKVQEKATTEQGAIVASGANLTFTPDAQPAAPAIPAAAQDRRRQPGRGKSNEPAPLALTPLASGVFADGALNITISKQSKVLSFRR